MLDGDITYLTGSDDDDLIHRCHQIRETVFIIEQNVSREEEIDAFDHGTTEFDIVHFLSIHDGEDIATGRMMVKNSFAKLQRIAVLKPWRGFGVGAAIVREMIRVAGTYDQVTEVALSAQTYAIPFYEGLGFTAFGDEYDDAGIPHRDMKRPL